SVRRTDQRCPAMKKARPDSEPFCQQCVLGALARPVLPLAIEAFPLPGRLRGPPRPGQPPCPSLATLPAPRRESAPKSCADPRAARGPEAGIGAPAPWRRPGPLPPPACSESTEQLLALGPRRSDVATQARHVALPRRAPPPCLPERPQAVEG